MKNAVNREKYYKISIYRILFLIFLFSLSICLVSEAKTFDYYYLNQAETAEKSISAKSFVKSVEYYNTHLKDAMEYIQLCKNDNSLPADEKEQCSNAVKAVKDCINGDIPVQSYDKISLFLGLTTRTVTEFEQKPEEAKALFKTCINADGSLKSKEELQKIDTFRYEECLNADKAINKNWIGSKELREKLIQFVKDNQL